LARKFVGDVRDPLIMERARATAESELQLAQIRRVKVTLIARIVAFCESKAPKSCIVRQRRQRPKAPTREAKASLAEPKAMTTSPRSEADRAVEAMRWALPELLKLDRYERRPAIRRERALRVIRADRIRDTANSCT
jgi:hypothetical protein